MCWDLPCLCDLIQNAALRIAVPSAYADTIHPLGSGISAVKILYNADERHTSLLKIIYTKCNGV